MIRCPDPRSHRRGAVAAALALAALIAGCTSGDADLVGTGLPGELQLSSPDTLFITDLTGEEFAVKDDTLSYDRNQVLYLGVARDSTTNEVIDSSAILARYDLTTLPDSLPAGVAFDGSNVTSVVLRLLRTNAYATPDSGTSLGDVPVPHNPQKVFDVYTLTDPLDTSLYPHAQPATDAQINLDHTPTSGSSIFIHLSPNLIQNWVENGMNGLMIREGEGSEPGLVGYASVDMKTPGYQELALVGAGTAVGPSLTVTVSDSSYTFLPVADVSTFDHLEPQTVAPTDGFEVQTHLRRYAYVYPVLPAGLQPGNVLINRAVLRLAIDPASFGPVESLVLREVPRSLLAGRDTVSIQEIRQASIVSTGQSAVDIGSMLADGEVWVGFNITHTIQRDLNGVFDTDTVLLITAGESFGGYRVSSNYTADFYFGRTLFHGTDDPDPALRPHVEITYTRFIGGGS